MVFYVKGVLLCMGVVIRASQAHLSREPAALWWKSAHLQRITRPVDSLSRALGDSTDERNYRVISNLFSVIFGFAADSFWLFCFLILGPFSRTRRCRFPRHTTRSEQIAQKQRKKKKKRLFYILTAKRWIDFHHLRASRPTTKKYSGRIVYKYYTSVQQVNEIFFSFYFTSCIQLARNLKTKKLVSIPST